MTVIQASLVKELRDRTGAGMMDCKGALVEVKGDVEQAIEFLRKKGLSSAAKKGGRVASEGLVHAYVSADRKVGALVEINCETDFVAKNALFKEFVQETPQLVASGNPVDLADLRGRSLSSGKTVDETVNSLVNRFGENIIVRRFARFEGEIDSYIHDDALTEGKIGVLLHSTGVTAEFAPFMKTLLLHIAAARPEFLRKEEVPAELLEREASIYRTQAIQEGKSGDILERSVQGRIAKFYKEVCLLEQNFVREPSKTVGAVLQEMNAGLDDEKRSVIRFARFEKGDAI